MSRKARHRATSTPLLWEYRYWRNQWRYFHKPRIKAALRGLL